MSSALVKLPNPKMTFNSMGYRSIFFTCLKAARLTASRQAQAAPISRLFELDFGAVLSNSSGYSSSEANNR